ncbi:MAG TPA: cytoplasmic protein [Oceanospirillaceae bacterium]|nr:cytoplasmic protein [Oceanospirillaceae bacterium]
MHVISKKIFVLAMNRFPNDASALLKLYERLARGDYACSADMKREIPSLDNIKSVKNYYVIDVGGNNLRVILSIYFPARSIWIKYIETHTVYNALCSKFSKGVL